MKKRSLAFQVWTIAKHCSQRPSQLLNLSNWTAIPPILGLAELVCLQFDLAIVFLGQWADNKLQEVDKNLQPRYHVNEILSDDSASSPNHSTLTDFLARHGERFQGLFGKRTIT